MIDDCMTAHELGAELATDYIRIDRRDGRWTATHISGDDVPVPCWVTRAIDAHERYGLADWEAQMHDAWAARTARMALLRRLSERDAEIIASWCGPHMTARTLSDIMILICATNASAAVRRVDGEVRTTISLVTRDDSIDGAGPTLAEAIADAVRTLGRRAW